MTMETELGKNGTTSLIDVLQQHDSTSESSSTILFFNICILLDMKSVSSLRHTCSRCNALLEHISEQFFSYHIDHFLFTRHDFHASVLNSKPLSQYLREQFYTLPAHHEQVTTELEPNNLSSSLHQDLARLNQQPLLENSNSPFETNDHFFRDLFKEFICTPLIDMNYEETDVNFKKYLGLGGVVRVTLYKPCRLLETVLSLVFKNHVSNEEPFQWNEQTYTKTNHHRKRKVAFHKFALLASLFPLLTSSSIHIKVEPCENMGHNEPLTTLLKTTPGGLLSWMYNGQVHPHDEWSESEDEEEIYQEGEYQTESDEDDASDDFGEFTQVPEGYFHSECFIHFQIPPHILSLNPYMERVLKYHHVSNTPHEERIEDFRRCDIFKYCARPPNSLYLRKGQEQKMEQVLANIREYLFNTNYEGNHIFDWSGTIERRKCWKTDPSCSLCFNINQIVVVPLIDFANTWRIRAIFPTNNEVIDRFEISFRKLSKNKTEKRPTCIVEYPPKPQPQFNLFAVNRIKIVDHKVNHHEFIVENETFSFTTYELTLEPSMDMMQTSFPAKKRKIFDVSLKTNKDNRFVQKLVAEFYIGLDGFNVVTLQNKFRGFEEALSYCFIPTYDPLKRIALYSKFLEKKYSPEYMSQEVTPMKGFKWIEEAGSNPNLESMIEILSEDPFFILYTLGFDSSYTDEEKQVTLDYLSTIDRIHHIAEYGRSWMLAFTLVQSLPVYPKLLLARKKTGYEAIFSAASRILSTDLFNQGVTKDEFIKASVLFYFKTKSLEIIPWD